VFFDRLVVEDATIMGLAVGPVVDVGPQLRVDAGGGLWIVDQGRRRAVAPEVAPAWRLAAAAAAPLTPEELALPEGTVLRPRPVLLQGTLPDVYLLDDHQCGVGDPDPSCVPEGEDETGGEESGDAGTGGSSGPGEDTGEASEEGSSDGTGGVLTGLPPAEEDDEAAGCGCTSGSSNGEGGLVIMAAAWLHRRRRPRSPQPHSQVAWPDTAKRSSG
jgi:MYXO-CTERM domain-containing protein